MLVGLLYRAYAIKSRILRRLIRELIKRLEGGEFYSLTLRKILLEYHDIEIGLYSYGGCFDLSGVPEGTRIGRYGSFGNFWVYSRNHPLDYISTHAFFFNTSLGYVDVEKIQYNKLHIGHDVWIGYGAIILPGVSKIGNGAVIGAGAVVTKNVPPYAVVVGNPGKIVRYRFPANVIDQIERMAWWTKNIDELKDEMDKFTHPFTGNVQ